MTAAAEVASVFAVDSESPGRATFFGPERRLFGVFEDSADASSDRGVVLCYPLGADYDSAFRSFRVLGTRLAKAGFHVLRFDYLGTGDSWGDAEDASIRQWTCDIGSAIEQLRTSRRVRDVSVVGLRMGAMLAALASAKSSDVNRLVLWEPATDGVAYLEAQRALHQAWMREERRNGRTARAAANELLGHEITETLRSGIEDVSIRSLDRMPASRIHVLTQDASTDVAPLVARLQALGADVEATKTEGPTVWSRTPLMPEAVVPTRALQSIVTWLDGASR